MEFSHLQGLMIDGTHVSVEGEGESNLMLKLYGVNLGKGIFL